MYTLTQTINYAMPFFDYSPVTAGFGQEPSVSVASMIRDTMLSAPFCWPWNRRENSTIITTAGIQDYTVSLTDFGFLEKASAQQASAITNVVGTGTTATMTGVNSFKVGDIVVITGLTHTAFNGTFTLTAASASTFSFASATVVGTVADTGVAVTGSIFELKDAYNTAALAAATAPLARPNSVAVILSTQGTSAKFRFMSVPDTNYQVTLTYQKVPVLMGPFVITSVNAASTDTVYTGTFDPLAFPIGSQVEITGFTGIYAPNNGSFLVLSCNATTLTVTNIVGVAVTAQGFVSNFDWNPIPDYFNYIYNSLYLGEMLAVVDDARAQLYRQRGVAGLLSKAEGLTEMQKNSFAQQWLARGAEGMASGMRVQQGNQARGL